MKNLILVFLVLFLVTNLFAQGQIINIPDDQPTIQEAINASNDGDTVLVADGLYFENINYRGKAIIVASHFLIDGNETHIDSTIINGSKPSNPDSGSVVVFLEGEDTTSVLLGFTITGGSGGIGGGHRSGGGISVVSSGAKIIYNKIINNFVTYSASVGGGILVFKPTHTCLISNNLIAFNKEVTTLYTGGGGGIHVGRDFDRYVVITNNVISHNTTSSLSPEGRGAGGGIDLNTSNSIISNNLIVFNTAYQGGGLDIYDGGLSESPIIINNTIAFNHATKQGGGIHVSNENLSYAPIENCIIWGNTAPENPQILSTGKLFASIEYSNIEGGYTGSGNIDADPLFADTINYYLTSESPCIDAGNPVGIFNDSTDPDNPGSPLFPAMGELRNDMGAYGGNPFMFFVYNPSKIISSCSLNNTYQVPGTDTVIVTSKIVSPENQIVDVKAIIENYDGSLRDSLTMFDDGTHKDSIGGDGLYTTFWPTVDIEEDYSIHMLTYLTNYEYLISTEDVARFTTKGPVGINDVEFLSDSVVGSRITFNLTLENLGITDSLNDITIDFIIPEDAGYKNASTGSSTFGDIAPGESKQCSRFYGIIFDDTCRTDSPYEIEIAIKSQNIIYWYDTLKINLIPTDIETAQNAFPEKYELFQNYPNPFNPNTTIKYSIPNVGRGHVPFVRLIVYDILGREVTTLVNKQQKPGYYEVNWDASNHPSGVYFYNLSAGSYVKTMKMVLLR
ncbi:MAG: T9SS type A sorting domain-containing protein [Chlorobi bacterium]|nr:T9SS type A sorting domain-containing protein [Chlorobiota bacterium]